MNNLLTSVALHVTSWPIVLRHATVCTLRVNQLFIFPLLELLNQLGQWSQFTRVNQIKLVDEIYEMLEACIQVRLRR